MVILHASWLQSQLWMWAERSGSSIKVKSGFSRWDGGPASLAAFASGSKPKETVAWLPSIEAGSLPSNSLLSDEPWEPDPADTLVLPWLVTAAPLDSAAQREFLSRCADRIRAGVNAFEPGVLIGDDLAFWTDAFLLARTLVEQQQFLPGIRESGDKFHARWEAVVTGTATRFAALARQMPGSARALNMDPEHPPSVPSRNILREFLDQSIDSAIRAAVHEERRRDTGSIHEAWLDALRSKTAIIAGADAKLRSLAAQIQQWRRPIEVQSAAPYRLCFRMHEPPAEGPDNEWRLDYLMQGIEDPSLLLPASAIWDSRKTSLAGSIASAAREQLLISLGQAAAISDSVAGSLKQKQPEGISTDTAGAYQFLIRDASALEQSGFAVMLPSWWTGRGPAQRLTARASVKRTGMSGGTGLSLSSVVEFDWKIALGEESLSLADLRALAKLKAPLVKVRGQWVAMSSEDIQAAIQYLGKKETATVGEMVRMAIGADGAEQPLFISGVEATGDVGTLLDQLLGKASFEELPPPDGLAAKLRPYQQRGFSWLDFLSRIGLGACLADDMGLGKTIQTLALIERRRAEQDGGPVLLVCPTSVVGNWRKEAARFTPQLAVMVHHGGGRRKGESFTAEAAKHNIVISSYALLYRDFELLNQVAWDGVVLDEAQNIKNAATRQAQAARSLKSDYRIALTGTPVENNAGDLWSLFEFLNPGLLGNQAQFKKRFFVPIQFHGNAEAARQLKGITGPFILRRLKTDTSIIADLPEKMEMRVYCNLTKEQASLYTAVTSEAEEALKDSSGIQRKGLVLATIAKLKQVCNHPAQFVKDSNASLGGRSGKLSRITEMLEEVLAAGDRALVFTQFAEMGELLRSHLRETFGREVYFLHGGVSSKQRDQMVERFGTSDGAPIFILSLKAGGTGLNLTTANHVFHYDRWWNPAVENQATDRAFRIGQRRNVQVHKFVCAGTLEERIDEMIESKKELAGKLVGTGEGWLTELSNTELKKLFALSKEAVGD